MVTNTYALSHGRAELGIRPGHHVIRLQQQGATLDAWEFDAVAGSRVEHAMRIPPPAQAANPVVTPEAARPSPSRLPAWALAGVGGAALAAGVVAGAIAYSDTKRLERTCPGDACPPTSGFASDRDGARTAAHAADVLLIGGAVVAASGVGWLLLTAPPKQPERRTTATGGCLTSGCFAIVRAAF